MFKPVYVSRDTLGSIISVTPVKRGVVKVGGCVMFLPNCKHRKGYFKGWFCFSGCGQQAISVTECNLRYGFTPPPGQVWLVKDGKNFITWTREDEHMPLLDREGTVLEEAKYVCR